MPQLGAAMEQQGRIVPTDRPHQKSLPCGKSTGKASIRSSEEQDRSRHHSAHRGGLELSTGTGLYGACRSRRPSVESVCHLYRYARFERIKQLAEKNQ
jgi:hypothetical protein